MRAAPAVDYPASQDGFWRFATALLGGVVAAVTAAWGAAWLAAGWPASVPAGAATTLAGALLTLVAAACGAGAGWRASRVPAVSLYWDGGRWQRRDARGAALDAGEPEVALDWGDWLLLRWRGDARQAAGRVDRVVYIPLARRDMPSRWQLFRVALQAPVRGGDAP